VIVTGHAVGSSMVSEPAVEFVISLLRQFTPYRFLRVQWGLRRKSPRRPLTLPTSGHKTQVTLFEFVTLRHQFQNRPSSKADPNGVFMSTSPRRLDSCPSQHCALRIGSPKSVTRPDAS
jgi:hypothetical protein